MIQGYGDVYRQGLADWNSIIDGLAKPTFDGVLALSDLPPRWRKPVRRRFPIRGRPRSSARSQKSGRGCLPAQRGGGLICRRLSALRGLHGHHLVVMGRRVALR